ncbi:MAG: M20/M25/M40 family metallo-hydrolase [Verrucomicrobia bacterium]|nr:M20/M25/M40 family metallo-hydrolase [Verrucomicrobiota bacterium]MCH8527496.1 M20/M25/M40 family metallo-hydrolase [Kiritimatiellia bacterium]
MTEPLHEARAVEHLTDLLAVPGASGRERTVADLLKKRLLAAGCEESWILEDDAHTRIPGDFEMGNLIVKLPGTVPGERLMFSGHMDTVPLCRGAVPKREGDRIVPEGDTALGADNRTACAAILVLAETLLREKLPHPPLTLIFSVGEEIGLWGAKEVNPADLGYPVMGFNIDSGDPARVIVGAIGAHRWEVKIRGVSAHAGVHPEHGVSAALIAARAVAWIAEKGYFGLIQKDGRSGTSNIGVIEGGEATNQVTDKVLIKGESRSHDSAFLEEITGTIQKTFEEAAASVVSSKGKSGSVEFICHKDYHAFRISEEEPAVARTVSALKALGLEAIPEVTNGGLDANFYNVKGIPTVTLGAGQHNPHTVDEYADVPEYLTACRLLLRIVADAAE